MSSTKVLRVTSIFIAAFLFGLAWVGIFRMFHGLFFEQEHKAAKSVAVAHHPAPLAAPVISMDDPGFTPPQVDENNPDAFDPEGIYTPENDFAGTAFSDFELFTINNKKLDVECDAKDFGALMPPSGSVESSSPSRALSGTSLKFSYIKIADGKIEFSTEPVDGKSYHFEGSYLVDGNFYTLDPDARVLKGVLSKLQNGERVAVTKASFTWSIDLECVC